MKPFCPETGIEKSLDPGFHGTIGTEIYSAGQKIPAAIHRLLRSDGERPGVLGWVSDSGGIGKR
jgi:hypothetical protein